MWITTYTVKGSGPFPADMLRYDTSFPLHGEDVEQIFGDWNDPTREVQLCRYSELKQSGWPTIDRWRSFDWAVIKDTIKQRKL